MRKGIKSFYIGWRSNPQLPNGGYYKAYGQLSSREAKKKEQCAYGSMSLTPYLTIESYNEALTERMIEGYSIL